MKPASLLASIPLLAAALAAPAHPFHALSHFGAAGGQGPSTGAVAVVERPEQGPPDPEPDCAEERALLEEARSALERSDYSAARELAARTIDSPLSRPQSERGDVWLGLLDRSGLVRLGSPRAWGRGTGARARGSEGHREHERAIHRSAARWSLGEGLHTPRLHAHRSAGPGAALRQAFEESFEDLLEYETPALELDRARASREALVELWVEEKPKHQALWEAKLRLRNAKDERGEALYTVRDWAAWVLTGDPD